MRSHRIGIMACTCVAVTLLASNHAHSEDTSVPPASKTSSAEQRKAEKKPIQQQASQKDNPVTTQPVGRPPESSQGAKPSEIATIFEQPGILTPRGTFVLEPSIQYSISSNNRIALVGYTIIPAVTIGLIDVRSVTRDTYVFALTARYGITNRLEAEVRVPYVYQTETSSTGNTDPKTGQLINEQVFNAEGNGIGDVEWCLRYQLNQPVTGPFFSVGLRAKAPTGKDTFEVPIDPNTKLQTELPNGSGFWGIQPSLTAIFPSDPAVFFAGISYTWNIERNVGTVNGQNFGTIDPGDVIGFNFGMGLAINEKASFSLGYDHSVIGKTRINNAFFANTENTIIGTLLFGYSYKILENTNLNLSLGVGATKSAPDVQLTLRLPTSF